MVEEVGELELGDGLPWLPLYKVRGQGVYKMEVLLTEGP